MDAAARRLERVAWVLCVALAALPILQAVLHLGRVHQDEVYQYLEPAYFRARGYGFLPWEWQTGLRNWAIPGLLAGLLRLSDALGIESPRIYRVVLALPQWMLQAFVLRTAFQWAQRRVGARAALLAAVLVGLDGMVIAMSGRTLGEAYSGALLVFAFACLDEARPARRPFWGGVWLGLAVVARYGSGVFVLAAIGVLAWRRAWRELGWVVLGGALVAAGLGALDAATWGAPFHTLVAYVRFNVVGQGAVERFGAMPAWFFLEGAVLALVPAWLWGAAVLALKKRSRPVSLAVVASGLYLVAISITPHKEARFVYPALLVLLVAGAPVLLAWLGQVTRPSTRIAVVAGAIASALVTFPFLHAVKGNEFRAIAAATRDPGAQGLVIVHESPWGAGGYFFIGKQIPWVTCPALDDRCREQLKRPELNRAVTDEVRAIPALEATGFHPVQSLGGATVLFR